MPRSNVCKKLSYQRFYINFLSFFFFLHTDLRRDLELLHHSELKEHANAGFDEVEL